jgi:hypothetical protein
MKYSAKDYLGKFLWAGSNPTNQPTMHSNKKPKGFECSKFYELALNQRGHEWILYFT